LDKKIRRKGPFSVIKNSSRWMKILMLEQRRGMRWPNLCFW